MDDTLLCSPAMKCADLMDDGQRTASTASLWALLGGHWAVRCAQLTFPPRVAAPGNGSLWPESGQTEKHVSVARKLAQKPAGRRVLRLVCAGHSRDCGLGNEFPVEELAESRTSATSFAAAERRARGLKSRQNSNECISQFLPRLRQNVGAQNSPGQNNSVNSGDRWIATWTRSH